MRLNMMRIKVSNNYCMCENVCPESCQKDFHQQSNNKDNNSRESTLMMFFSFVVIERPGQLQELHTVLKPLYYNLSMSAQILEENNPAALKIIQLEKTQRQNQGRPYVRHTQMSRNPPGCLAEHVCVCVSVRACVLAVRVMSEGESRGTPRQASSCIINPQLPSRHQPTTYQGVELLYRRGQVRLFNMGRLSTFLIPLRDCKPDLTHEMNTRTHRTRIK